MPDSTFAAPCTPQGAFFRPPLDLWKCGCGELLTPVPFGGEWRWADSKGRTEHKDGAPAWVADLTAKPEGFWAALATADIGTYSNLRAFHSVMGTLPWLHVHHKTQRVEPQVFMPPWCCDMPMYAHPDGWQCRVRKGRPVTYLLAD